MSTARERKEKKFLETYHQLINDNMVAVAEGFKEEALRKWSIDLEELHSDMGVRESEEDTLTGAFMGDTTIKGREAIRAREKGDK